MECSTAHKMKGLANNFSLWRHCILKCDNRDHRGEMLWSVRGFDAMYLGGGI